MIRWWLSLAVILGLVLIGAPTHASTGLKIQPLEYTAQLEKGQRQRGVVDISNPYDEVVQVELSVRAVRQISNDGELEFYNDEAITKGVKLDHQSINLEPKGAYRLVFELDASKLPNGDSVAAIFAQTVVEAGSIGGVAQVGSLLFITNGTSRGHEVSISNLSMDWLQSSGEVTGSYRVANTSPVESTGFRPKINIQLWPFHQPKMATGPLVFAGYERSADFSIPSKAFGIYKLTVSSGDSQQVRWVFLLPAWSALVAAGLLLLAIGWRYFRRRKSSGKY